MTRWWIGAKTPLALVSPPIGEQCHADPDPAATGPKSGPHSGPWTPSEASVISLIAGLVVAFLPFYRLPDDAMFDLDVHMPRRNKSMVYFGACLMAGIRLARERRVNARVRPPGEAIEESVDQAHEIYNPVFRKVRSNWSSRPAIPPDIDPQHLVLVRAVSRRLCLPTASQAAPRVVMTGAFVRLGAVSSYA